MKIYTSYYSKLKNMPEDAILMSVSRTEPKGVHVHFKWEEVAPTSEILYGYKKGTVSKEAYTAAYLDQLRQLYKAGRLSAFIDWAKKQDKPVILLCWEKPGDFCHRIILADALNKAFKADITEY